jgi:UDP-N-acetyl-D-galactosamine dehydrogenase
MVNQATKVGVVGLGYVGLPLALALGRAFPQTIGFDVSDSKVNALLSGQDPTCDGFEGEVKESQVRFTTDETSLGEADVIIVAVPTPIDENRQPDLTPLVKASQSVGRNIKRGAVVVFESTVYPGVTEDVCGPIIEKESGFVRGVDFFLGYSPERINPGDKEHTLEKIVKVIAGENPEVTEKISQVYGAVVKAGLFKASSIRVFDRMGIRTTDVLQAAGTKWNFLKFSPGLVGGHCIGVDPYYLTAKAQQLGYHPQVILAGRRINDDMGRFVAQRTVKLMIQSGIALKGAKIGILGVTFKEDVTDTRNSRVPDIAYELKEFGIEPVIHDPLADSEVVRHEYGLELSPLADLNGLEGLIVAVGHRQIREAGISSLAERVIPGGVFVDIKSLFNPSDVPAHVAYWSL